MMRNPNLDFSNDIIKACLTNFAYDGQCENSRGVTYLNLFYLLRIGIRSVMLLFEQTYDLPTNSPNVPG